MNNKTILQLNEANFETQVKQSSVPVLVDFWADWCQPCHILAPTIDALADEYVDRINVGKVDVDTNHPLAKQYAIQSIPTTLLFVDGQVVERFVGVVSKDDLKRAIDQSLNVATA